MTRRMHPSLRLTVLVAVLAIAATALPADATGGGPAQATPELTAGPATGLVDGQEVTVTGSGFAPDHLRWARRRPVHSGAAAALPLTAHPFPA